MGSGILPDNEHVAIIVASCNGEKFITEQLESFMMQSHQNWSLWVSDDASTDSTLDILYDFAQKNSNRQIEIFRNSQNCRDFCKNFMSLMQNTKIQADYYAISDQDDIWKPEKLTHAIRTMKKTNCALYGGRTELIDQNGMHIGYSPLFSHKPNLRNAIVQSIMGGNTMVIRDDAMTFFRQTPNVDVVSHDWWLYILLSAGGFGVHYDKKPMIMYRQHDDNLVGSNVGIKAKFSRIKRMLKAEFKDWNRLHLEALDLCSAYLDDEAKQLLTEFSELRKLRAKLAIKKLKKLGLYRQTRLGQLALKGAAFIGKL